MSYTVHKTYDFSIYASTNVGVFASQHQTGLVEVGRSVCFIQTAIFYIEGSVAERSKALV